MRRSDRDALTPVVSVIVPTYDRPQQLAGCLESLAALQWPPTGFEIIVVDDGGHHPLEGIIAPFRSHLQITLTQQANAGAAAARNNGARVARGRFLAFVDDDCRPSARWLEALVRRLEAAPSRMVVGGPTLNGLPHNLWATASHALIEAVDVYFNTPPSQARHLISGNLAISRTAFWTVGGFDPTLSTSEDRDFCTRCAEQGYTMIIEPEATVTHVRPLTVKTFWRQHFEYGRGTLAYHRRRAGRAATAFEFDGGFYLHLLRHPFGRYPAGRALLLSALLGVTQAAKTAGLLWQWMRDPGAERATKPRQRAPIDPGNARDVAD